MTDRELMQQALDALINAKGYIFYNVLDDAGNRYDIAIEALRARLAAAEPEQLDEKELARRTMALYPTMPVRATEEPICTPPQREWQGLTDEDKKQIAIEANNKSEMTAWEYAQRIGEFTEAKLREKNSD